MAGLAGHTVDENALFGTGPGTPWNMPSATSGSPEVLVHDLTNLFEAVGGHSNNTGGADGYEGNGAGFSMSGVEGGAAMDLMGSGYGSEDQLSRILRDLF